MGVLAGSGTGAFRHLLRLNSTGERKSIAETERTGDVM